MTASLCVYFGPVAVLVCRRFDHTLRQLVDDFGIYM